VKSCCFNAGFLANPWIIPPNTAPIPAPAPPTPAVAAPAQIILAASNIFNKYLKF